METLQVITEEVISGGLSYEEYREELKRRIAHPEGDSYSESLMEYTVLNDKRMDRLDKTIELDSELVEQLSSVNDKMTWVVLTEGWCGDAAQNIPAIAKMAEQSEHIELKLIYRDEHPDVMDAYLTNGGKSIPKLVCLNEDLDVLWTWGPRPAPVQERMMEHKANPTGSYEELAKELHLWYAKDKTSTIQNEFKHLLNS